jgi:DNA-binding transcriptional ArsR family regulator
MRVHEMHFEKELNGHKVCEALSLPSRMRILQELIKAYPNRLTISKLQQITSEPRMTVWFHMNKLREANLVELNGSRRGFKAVTRALIIRFDGNGIQLEEEKE